MDTALLLARIVLSVVFAIAGIGKLLDLKGAESALAGFGIPKAAAKPGAVILPVVELAIAILLLPMATAWYAGIAALVLLLIFCIGIAYNMAKGNHPDCHCFGQFHSEPAGWSTLIRNLILAGVAGFLVAYGTDRWSFSNGDAGTSIGGWWNDASNWERVISVGGLLLLAGLIIEGWLLYHLLGQNGRMLLRIDQMEAGLPADQVIDDGSGNPSAGLKVGTVAPTFKLEGLFGETTTLDSLRSAGRPVLLLFMDPNCGPCNAMLPDVGQWAKDHASRLTMAMVTRGGAEANKPKATQFGLQNVLLQTDREVAEQYSAHGTPSGVIINPDGTVGSPLAVGADAIRNLVSRTTGSLPLKAAPAAPAAPAPAAPPAAPPARRGLEVGALAPAVTLPDLAGKTVELSQFKGDPTMVLFWNPGCGFCKRMADDLKAWEANPPAGAPKLLVVSTGTPEANKELGLNSPTLLDANFSTGRSFGASGTPSAVLVDAEGKIGSDLVVGAPGVLAMARNE